MYEHFAIVHVLACARLVTETEIKQMAAKRVLQENMAYSSRMSAEKLISTVPV